MMSFRTNVGGATPAQKWPRQTPLLRDKSTRDKSTRDKSTRDKSTRDKSTNPECNSSARVELATGLRPRT